MEAVDLFFFNLSVPGTDDGNGPGSVTVSIGTGVATEVYTSAEISRPYS